LEMGLEQEARKPGSLTTDEHGSTWMESSNLIRVHSCPSVV
jgi:hypothetical protein